jgi:hypothetical protein
MERVTNRDKINGMSNIEFAEFIFDTIVTPCRMCSNSYYNEELEMHTCKDLEKNCAQCFEEWLEQEVKE